MTLPHVMNGEPLTDEETAQLQEVLTSRYRDPRTGRNLPEALAAMKATRWWSKAKPIERSLREERLRTRYRQRATEHAQEPRSPHYLHDAVHRTASDRLRREVADGTTGGLQYARRWSRDYHLRQWDPDVIRLQLDAFA